MPFLATIRSSRSRVAGFALRTGDLFRPGGSAAQSLAQFVVHPAAISGLRWLLHEAGWSGHLSRLTDTDVVSEAERLLRTGDLVLAVEEIRPLERSVGAPPQVEAPPPPPAPSPRQPEPEPEEPEPDTFLATLDSLVQAAVLQAAAAIGAPFCPT